MSKLNKKFLSICPVHGETLFRERYTSRGNRTIYPSCRECENAQVRKYRVSRKTKAVEYKGGKCALCGYNKTNSALEFHHVDPTEKRVRLEGKSMQMMVGTWADVLLELDKCLMVCANCHREIHDGLHPDILKI